MNNPKNGFSGSITKPTEFLVGESGKPEYSDVTKLGTRTQNEYFRNLSPERKKKLRSELYKILGIEEDKEIEER